MSTIPLLVGAIASILIPIVLFAQYTFFSPLWLQDDEAEGDDRIKLEIVKANWKKYKLIALISGIILSLGSLLLFWLQEYYYAAVYIAPIVSTLTFLTVISLLTDINLRLVDRWILRTGLLINTIISVTFLILHGTNNELLVFSVVMGFVALYFFIPLLGMSDTRALLIIVASIFPYFHTPGIAISIGGSVLISLIYVLYKNGFKFKALTTKTSLPLVPIVLAPAIPTLIAGVFFI